MTTNPKIELHQALLTQLGDTLDIIQGVIKVHPEYASLSPLEAILKGTIRAHQSMPIPYPRGLEPNDD